MATFKHIGETIYIDDLEIPLSLFLVLEPQYGVAKGMESLIYKDGILKVRVDGITSTLSNWSNGDRYIARKNDFATLIRLTQKEDKEINEEVSKMARPEECRMGEYPSYNDLIVALWEHIVEGKDPKDSGVEDLQAKRVEIKNKYPLKETTDGADKVKGRTETVLPKGTRRTRNRSKHSG